MDEYDYEEGYQLFLNIEEVRRLYSHTCYSIKIWPGSPARPVEEQEYLQKLKTQLFAMMADHSFRNG
jgi:hypothetical protein|tara:strand:+ start:2402 stop:2602 length:201 start_codon:yes stop_codon:yes gene_type:complete